MKAGDITPLDTGNKQILGFVRQWKDEAVLVLLNLNPSWQEIELQLDLLEDCDVLYSDGEVEWGGSEEKTTLQLSPRSTLIISLH